MELNLIVDERRESRDGTVIVVLVPCAASPVQFLGSWTLYEQVAPDFVRSLRGGQVVRLDVDIAPAAADVDEFLAPARRAFNIMEGGH